MLKDNSIFSKGKEKKFEIFFSFAQNLATTKKWSFEHLGVKLKIQSLIVLY